MSAPGWLDGLPKGLLKGTTMSESKDGGPAFPVHAYVNSDGETHESKPQGMTLRDYFAAKVMAGRMAYSADGDSYDPPQTDADFTPAINPTLGELFWYKASTFWQYKKHSEGLAGALIMTSTYHHRLARESYEIADAMLKARKA